MKDQYFGNRADHFKFSLALHLLDRTRGLERLTYLPMLTANDDKPHGERESRLRHPGYGQLHAFLQKHHCRPRSGRSLKALAEFMDDAFYAYSPYGDGVDTVVGERYFAHERRSDYFMSVQASHLRRAAVLLDPDTGLALSDSTHRSRAHVHCREIGQLLDRLDDLSVLLVFQYRQQGRAWDVTREDIAAGLEAESIHPDLCTSVIGSYLAFLVFANTPPRSAEVKTVLDDYCAKVTGEVLRVRGLGERWHR